MQRTIHLYVSSLHEITWQRLKSPMLAWLYIESCKLHIYGKGLRIAVYATVMHNLLQSRQLRHWRPLTRGLFGPKKLS